MKKMKTKIRFGIIGCSSIAERSTIPAIKETAEARLQMIGSRSLGKAKKFARKFSCEQYGKYNEVIGNDDVDAVYISLPIGLQEKWVIKAAKAGKHILCEKSAASSYESAKRMISECKKNNVRIMEGFAFRFHPQHEQVLKIIHQNRLGKIFSFSGKYGFLLPYSSNNFRFKKELGGGALNDLGCYLICASRMIFQNNPIVVSCNLHYKKKNGIDVKGSIYMIYPNQLIAYGVFGYENDFQSIYDVWGSKGSINLDWAFNIKKNMFAGINFHTKNKFKKIRLKPANQFRLMIFNFCKEFQNPGYSMFNYEDDLLCQARTMDAARQSDEKKRPIFLKEIK